MIFNDFTDDARIWLYQSNRALSQEEQSYLHKQMQIFVDQWSAHGKKLTAAYAILDEFRVAICAEANVEASGCSIDASVRFMKEIGAELQVDFFNRLLILAEKEGQKELVPFAQLRSFPELTIYQPNLTSLGSLRKNEKLAVKDFLQA